MVRSSDHGGDDLRLFSFDLITVQSHEDCHCKECTSFVAVAVRMVRHETESVRSSQSGEINRVIVRPLVARPGESGFERVLVANARQSTMLPQLIEVYCIHDNPFDPARLPLGTLRAWRSGAAYLASSRRAFRYFLAARPAIASASSTPGS